MKKLSASILLLLFLLMNLTGCGPVGDKDGSLSLIYGAAAVLSLILLVGCVLSVRKDRFWFTTLFTSVLVVNVGYTLLSLSPTLQFALWANRISYLGSVFLPLSMLMIIMKVSNTPYKKCLPRILSGVSVLVFLIAASPGILPIYYKEVSLAVVDGVSTLIKVYGPLHSIYLVYLLGYFSAMVAVIIRANIKKTIDTNAHAIIIAIAVFVNIGVWLIEQLVAIDFEFLSISYIISELFLLGVHLVMKENQRLREVVRQIETVHNYREENSSSADIAISKPLDEISVGPERIENFMTGLTLLTPTEKAICDLHISRVTSKEIMAELDIKENTLKYHNRNIYAKLGVSGRKELLELHKHIVSVKEKLESNGKSV